MGSDGPKGGESRDKKLPGDRDDPGRKSWCQPIVSCVHDPSGERDGVSLMLRAGQIGRKGVVRAADRPQTSAFKAQGEPCIIWTGPSEGFRQGEPACGPSAERWRCFPGIRVIAAYTSARLCAPQYPSLSNRANTSRLAAGWV